ncbi:MAG: iron-sulfur cluster repair di-iron protein [Phycisphaeraceae bacterium]|nr:iron-sulfur cluster repair di-iron protein [Phycisphaeraceae bacterium]
MTLTLQSVNISVGQLVADQPSRSRVFEKLGIDYCCGGQHTLAQACRDKQLAPDKVMELLDAEDRTASDAPVANPSAMTLTDLADHIVATHHAYLRTELPRLQGLFAKVVAAHGAQHAWVHQASEVFTALAEEMNDHTFKEEQILFPMIRRIDAGNAEAAGHCGGVENPIRVMMLEHDKAGEALRALRLLSGDFSVPSDACNTFRALLAGLEEFERDLHQHVHKENNILFPRSVAAANALKQPTQP